MRIFIQILLFSFAIPIPVFADAYDVPPVMAVQDRSYTVNHEITPHLGILPLDPFNRSLLIGASYTYKLQPDWNWEVVNASLTSNWETDLKQSLKNAPGEAQKGLLDEAKGLVTTQILYTPFYGKYLFSDRVVHNELGIGASGGIINYKDAGTIPILGPSFVARFFVSQSSSIKFDARVLYQATSTQNSNTLLYFTLGYSINLDRMGAK